MVKYIALAVVALLPFVALVPAATEIPWRTDIDAAFQQAAEQGKWVYASLYTTTCPYCVRMDREVYSKPDIADLLSKFVPLKVNGALSEDFVAKYHVEGFPTALVLTSDRKVVESLTGYMPADVFTKRVKPLAEGKNPLEEFAAKADAEPKSATTQIRVGYEFFQRQWYDRSRTYLERAMELSTDDTELREEAMRLLIASYLYESNTAKAVEWLGKYEKSFPGSEYTGAMLFDLGQIHFEKEEYTEAAKYFERAKDAASGFMLRTRANWMLSEARTKIGQEAGSTK